MCVSVGMGVYVCLCASAFEPYPTTGGRPRLRMVQRERGGLSRLVRRHGVQEDEDTAPGEKQCRGVVSRGRWWVERVGVSLWRAQLRARVKLGSLRRARQCLRRRTLM